MIQHPSILYYIALIVWPLVAIKIFRKYPLDNATFLCVVIPYLVLPVPPDIPPIDLPLFPPLDKNFIPLVVLFFLVRKRIHLTYFPQGLGPRLFIALLLFSPIFTTLTNPEPLVFGPRTLPGLNIRDTIGITIISMVEYYVPFIVGYSVLKSAESHQKMIRILGVGGLFYALLMLYEIRMSPQLHVDIYGYFPHDFGQQKRAGGFRPVVFIGHGLLVAFYAMMAAACVYTMFRQRDAILKGRGWFFLAYIVVTLVLCKTFSAIIYFLIFLASCFFLTQRGQLRVALTIAMLLVAYPVVRVSGMLPLDELVEFFQGIDEARAGSLAFRLENEESLLARANEKKWFGWGNWGRNHIYHDTTGKMLSVTDGTWIVVMGAMGWSGYIGVFGTLCYPLFALLAAIKKKGNAALHPSTATLAFIVALYSLDQIPNSSLNQMSFVISGALLGWAEQIKYEKSGRANAASVKV